MSVPYRNRPMKKYARNMFGVGSIVLGTFFVVEHIITWGEFSVRDLIGHEYLGLGLILFGILINLNFKTKWSSELSKIKGWFKRKDGKK